MLCSPSSNKTIGSLLFNILLAYSMVLRMEIQTSSSMNEEAFIYGKFVGITIIGYSCVSEAV